MLSMDKFHFRGLSNVPIVEVKMRFNNFVGNDKTIIEIKNLMKQDRFPHAVIIEGDNGTGKTMLAKLIAKWAVCSSDNVKPCDVCSHCLKADNDIHPDIITISKPKDKSNIPVALIRSIRSDAYVLPNEANRKVYIIDDSNNMDTYSQNTILKILEEPPKTAMFIMTCNSSLSMLETVRSRSSIFSLLPVSEDLAINFLKEHCPTYSSESISKAVKATNGNIGKSILALENSYFSKINETTEIIAFAIGDIYEFNLLSSLYTLTEDKNFALDVIKALLVIIRDSVVFSDVKNTLSISNKAVEYLSGRLSKRKLLKLIEVLYEAESKLNSNININLFVTWLCVKIRESMQ